MESEYTPRHVISKLNWLSGADDIITPKSIEAGRTLNVDVGADDDDDDVAYRSDAASRHHHQSAPVNPHVQTIS